MKVFNDKIAFNSRHDYAFCVKVIRMQSLMTTDLLGIPSIVVFPDSELHCHTDMENRRMEQQCRIYSGKVLQMWHSILWCFLKI